MTRQITFCVVADGGTDRALIPIIEWAIHRLDPDVDILEPDFRKRVGSVRDFLSTFETGSMLVFVHRDAEGDPLESRLQEFEGHNRDNVVPVIPVRMTEAWLLIDGPAIAKAADRPHAFVDTPPLMTLSNIANPKTKLEELLLVAAGGLTGRRLKQFRQTIITRRVSVAGHIPDFSPLEAIEGFKRFQDHLAAAYPYKIC